MEDERPFDPFKVAEKRKELYANWRITGPKLSFEERCQAYALMHQGEPQSVICEAFHISRATASAIAGCRFDDRTPVTIEIEDGIRTHTETHLEPKLNHRRVDGHKPKYQEVAREFESLGYENFIRTYATRGAYARAHAASVRVYLRKRRKGVDED